MIDARAYWKQLVKDYYEASESKVKLTDKDLDAIVESLFNNDNLWADIDYYVEETITRQLNEEVE